MRAFRRLVVPAILTAVPASPASAQLEPPSTGGLVVLQQELRMLGHYKRVLMIGAHPDDEDTELLTVLVRGEGAEAAYLSLNRGRGRAEPDRAASWAKALGLIRSEELLGARRLDGAQQFFTRAYDFGFLQDAGRHLAALAAGFGPEGRRPGHPDVPAPGGRVSIFTGTPRDGHGQHQAAGWAAMEAFRIAGDSCSFPRLAGVPAWTPLKLYRSTRFDSAATDAQARWGELDPAVGSPTIRSPCAGGVCIGRRTWACSSGSARPRCALQLVTDRTGSGGSGVGG